MMQRSEARDSGRHRASRPLEGDATVPSRAPGRAARSLRTARRRRRSHHDERAFSAGSLRSFSTMSTAHPCAVALTEGELLEFYRISGLTLVPHTRGAEEVARPRGLGERRSLTAQTPLLQALWRCSRPVEHEHETANSGRSGTRQRVGARGRPTAEARSWWATRTRELVGGPHGQTQQRPPADTGCPLSSTNEGPLHLAVRPGSQSPAGILLLWGAGARPGRASDWDGVAGP
jgi:hypothetical protein